MLSNSVAIKEESSWIEFYYRSLRPWQHYVPLPQGDAAAGAILGLVDRLKGDDAMARAIAERAQQWAYR